MADITVTATAVLKVSGSIMQKNAGEAITAGQALYESAAGTLLKANNSGNATVATVAGIALNGGAVGQPIVAQKTGEIVIGGTVASGTIYTLSNTAGLICPSADLNTNMVASVIGIGKHNSTNTIVLGIVNSGATKP